MILNTTVCRLQFARLSFVPLHQSFLLCWAHRARASECVRVRHRIYHFCIHMDSDHAKYPTNHYGPTGIVEWMWQQAATLWNLWQLTPWRGWHFQSKHANLCVIRASDLSPPWRWCCRAAADAPYRTIRNDIFLMKYKTVANSRCELNYVNGNECCLRPNEQYTQTHAWIA